MVFFLSPDYVFLKYWGPLTCFLSALIFYEYAITFNNEVRLIWRRRITAASVLFFLNRYIMILDNIVTLISFPAMSNRVSSEDLCS